MRVLGLLGIYALCAALESTTSTGVQKECLPEMKGNGKCDIVCAYTNDDGGDCTRDSVCREWGGDSWCDTLCYDEVHDWDGGDCLSCPEGWKGDGFCDLGCMGDERDGGDCEVCPEDWIGDDFCDPECMTEDTHYDHGDCYFEFKI